MGVCLNSIIPSYHRRGRAVLASGSVAASLALAPGHPEFTDARGGTRVRELSFRLHDEEIWFLSQFKSQGPLTSTGLVRPVSPFVATQDCHQDPTRSYASIIVGCRAPAL